MKRRQSEVDDELRAEYQFDYTKAIRGKYSKRLVKEGSTVIVLDPDVAKSFRSSAAVNDALRSLLDITRSTQRLTKVPGGRTTKNPAHRPT